MKFPNWFRIAWWLLLVIILASLLFFRRNALIAGDTNANDVFLLGIFTAVMLVPIFSEMEFLGVKLKQEIAALKEDLRIKIGEIKNHIENKQHQTVHNTIHGQSLPASDEKLDKMQADIAGLMALQENRGVTEAGVELTASVPGDTVMAFKVRYLFEEELKRIWSETGRGSDDMVFRPASFQRMVEKLVDRGILDRELSGVIGQIFKISSVKIHGGELTETQKEFLKTNWENVYQFLKSL
ncbi:hypothetical protein LPB86_17060 [Pedobacter sp. MC2016-14]|uniref:hypothetical protein n=1 Tax=Pedobacter sp. MC2016-14 TaxID=2897327 RepID=UPI001E4260F2|nr:hypothetical protein [Pedobacter sp. MC2016-14]MCD0489955.1 hypothetical protein [Pedobacter sp. MC2016-14]